MRRALDLSNKFALLFAGRLDPQKNPLFLLEIFNQVLNEIPDSVLFIAGDGIMMKDCREKATGMGIEGSVVFLGNRTDVNELMQAADVFVLPSLFEGLGIVLIEAQAAGLPCFTSKDVVPAGVDITGLVDFISPESGAQIWAQEIVSAYKKKQERKNTQSLIKAAGYDSADNARLLEEKYLKLCGK